MKTQTTRRALVVGLAVAPIAGLPAIAGAVVGDDPVLAAIAERDCAHAAWETITKADAALGATREAIGMVTYKGEKVYNLAHFNDLAGLPRHPMTAAELEETIAQYRRGWAMQQEELASPDPEYQVARAALGARQAAFTVEPDDSAEEALSAAFDAFDDAECAVFEAEPTTQAGAVALLRFTAEFLEELGINDTRVEACYPTPSARPRHFLEREARA